MRQMSEGRFPTTRFSAVRGAASTDAEERERAWEVLASAYLRPVFFHLRTKWRRSREDAEDLTQAFFARAMERDFFASYDPERARFRTFLRTCLDRFAQNEHEARGRLKRGGGALRLDVDALEREISDPQGSPEEIFEREWRRSVFTLGIEALRAQCQGTDKQSCFELFARYDLTEPEERPTYAELARAFD